MQNVNDDMDSLFRKAGVDYPLFTGGADWSKVASALETREEPPAPGKNYGKYLGLILVLLLPYLLTQYDLAKPATAGLSENKQVNIVNPDRNDGPSLDFSSSTVTSINSKTTVEPGNDPVMSEPTPIANQITSTEGKNSNGQESSRQSGINYFVKNSKSRNDAGPAGSEKSASIASAEKTNLPASGLNPMKQHAERSPSNTYPLTENKSIPPADTVASSLTLTEEKKEENKTIPQAEISVNAGDKKEETEKPVVSTSPRKRFYVGIVGGINATSIKMQDVKELGSDYGFIAGYNFMKNWSIEAGVLSSSKYYYSDGKYLDNPKIYMPPNAKINTVEGDCRMIEIPILLKYDFGFKRNHNWFATGGISSFLMKKEDYAYDYYYPATGTSYLYKKTYENESENWAAVMQLSAGYNRTIMWGLNLRFEPFVQIPLKGAGYGKLPLTSGGFRLGVTRKIF